MSISDDSMKRIMSHLAIGKAIFSAKEYTELRMCMDHDSYLCISLGCHSADETLDIWQEKSSLAKGICLYPGIDRTEALKLAGLLIAWAEDEGIHGPMQQGKENDQ